LVRIGAHRCIGGLAGWSACWSVGTLVYLGIVGVGIKAVHESGSQRVICQGHPWEDLDNLDLQIRFYSDQNLLQIWILQIQILLY
jgi:hypothetical protein